MKNSIKPAEMLPQVTFQWIFRELVGQEENSSQPKCVFCIITFFSVLEELGRVVRGLYIDSNSSVYINCPRYGFFSTVTKASG